MKFCLKEISAVFGVLFCMIAGTVYADQESTNYGIGVDVLDVGGADVSKSTNYLLSDSIGDFIVGDGASTNYKLDSGYRQPSAADFLSMACSASVAIGSSAGAGQKTGSGTCTVYTDAYNGYNLGWAILSGSGGVNTGSLISQYNDTIVPYTPSISDTPETWSVAAASAEWGGRLRSGSTDTAAEWGLDAVSDKWLNVRTSNRTLVVRSNSTPILGSTEILQFRSEIGASAFQPTGNYAASVTLTVVGY